MNASKIMKLSVFATISDSKVQQIKLSLFARFNSIYKNKTVS